MKNRLMFPAAIPLFALSVFSVDAAPLHSGLTDSLGNGRPIVFVQDAKGECDPAQQECPPNEGEHKKKDGAHEQKPPKHEEPAAQPPAAEPAKPEPKPEAKPEPKPEPKPELKPEPKAESKPEPQGEAKPEPKPEPKAEAPKQDMKVQDIEPPKPSEEGRPELKPGTKHDARKPKPPVNEDLAKPVPPEPKAAEPAPDAAPPARETTKPETAPTRAQEPKPAPQPQDCVPGGDVPCEKPGKDHKDKKHEKEGQAPAPAANEQPPAANENGKPGQTPPPAEPAAKPGAAPVAPTPVAPQPNDAVNAPPAQVLPQQNGAPILDSQKTPVGGNTGDQPDPGRKRHDHRQDQGQQGQVQPVPGQPNPPQPVQNAVPPKSDADAQAAGGQKPWRKDKFRSSLDQQGQRMKEAPNFEDFGGARVEGRVGNRVIIDFGSGMMLRGDDDGRMARESHDSYYEELPGGLTRQVVDRGDGIKVVTIRNRWGEIVQRSRIVDGREYVLFYAPQDRDADRDTFRDPGDDLPPIRLNVPLDRYIIDTSSDRNRDYRDFLEEPPIAPVERVYSIDEVKYSARLRDVMARIDLDTITFDTGSASISMDQAATLKQVADAIKAILRKSPAETFLIEGHTDAVGSAESNLVLSGKRAESVANVLTDVFDIPPENLATQGYGERYLKIATDGPERLNRRVAIRRITPLVRPAGVSSLQ